MIKLIAIAFLTGPISITLAADSSSSGKAGVEIYTPKELAAKGAALDKKGTPFASESLDKFDKHYTMLAYRSATGSAEVHEHEADFFVVESGEGTLLRGGKVVNGKETGPGEIRGTSIEGGSKSAVMKGDIVHIPAGVPHQLLIENGKPFTYFVIKVTGQ